MPGSVTGIPPLDKATGSSTTVYFCVDGGELLTSRGKIPTHSIWTGSFIGPVLATINVTLRKVVPHRPIRFQVFRQVVPRRLEQHPEIFGRPVISAYASQFPMRRSEIFPSR